MKLKTNHIILTLTILSTILLVFNGSTMQYWQSITVSMNELYLAAILFAIGVLGLIAYYYSKKWRKVLIKIIIGVFALSLLLNIRLSVEQFKVIQKNRRIAEYYEYKTCEEIEIRFAEDLKNDKIKYFQFGIASTMGMDNLLESKYDIEYCFMGCLLQSEMEYYNELVNKYLKENYNQTFSYIYEEIK